ncbi:ThiF family adenylyltransferase [Candidatus Cetobacterium colombiensis]|uniref:ThiF family adenylyltransferase n=1 Tax=Candidatus Cetobacterium colombiensis TaxID=3073100 RepID=A0ABU4WBU8_9FUSO|nr:ThiF family adenylyltransferase [Candidatus Cetobacterium colombiensis]MDX8337018.1 ThiF family adenylyltransferase [Candidatus Cetobacterium colombiensis]
MEKYEIRFKKNNLDKILKNLFLNKDKEQFCIVLAKKDVINQFVIFKEIEVFYPKESDVLSSSLTHISIKKEFIYRILLEFNQRVDIDTLIEIHTHPFLQLNDKVNFSSTDNEDEINFNDYLKSNYSNLNYASVVLSDNSYEARIYLENEIGKIKIKELDVNKEILNKKYLDIYERNIDYMGLNNLKKIFSTEKISIVGVGGLGSIVAEHLVNMGFNNLVLIDNDVVEYSNLNRLVGAKYKDAQEKKLKVEVVKKHLLEINPFLNIKSISSEVKSDEALNELVESSKVFLTTDNHSSRALVNDFCLKYFIPFISIGVNISVINNAISDISGEIIKIFPGDKFCLRCLQRIRQINVDYENIENEKIKEKILKRGYLKEHKEPAVKTLNTILASLGVDSYVNEFTNYNRESSILVYENNKIPIIYEDNISIKNKNKNCYVCNL